MRMPVCLIPVSKGRLKSLDDICSWLVVVGLNDRLREVFHLVTGDGTETVREEIVSSTRINHLDNRLERDSRLLCIQRFGG